MMGKKRKLGGEASGETAPLSAFAAARARIQQRALATSQREDVESIDTAALVPLNTIHLADRSPALVAQDSTQALTSDDEQRSTAPKQKQGSDTQELIFSEPGPVEEALRESGSDEVLITLSKDQILCCVGIFEVDVQRGAIDVMGALIFEDSSCKPLTVYAPSTQALPTIRCLSPRGADIKLCSASETATSLTRLECFSPLYRRIWHSSEPGPINQHEAVGRSFTILVQSSDDALHRQLRALVVPKEWYGVFDRLKPFESSTITAVIGGKGSGRSALCRLLANSLVTRRKNKTECLLIDLDPVVPITTLHGQISACAVKLPMLGPSFTMDSVGGKTGQIEILRSHPVSVNGIRDDPVAYIAAAQDLFETCHQQNTTGTSTIVRFGEILQGSRVAVLLKLLRILKPTQTIWMMRGAAKALDDIVEIVEPKTLLLLPPLTSPEYSRSNDEAHDMQVLSEFHRSFSESGSQTWIDTLLAGIAPTCVSFKESQPDFLAVLCLPTSPSPLKVAGLLNASLVSIVVLEDNAYSHQLHIQREENSGIPVIQGIEGQKSLYLDPRKSRLLGAALIRGISFKRKHLQLIMPPGVRSAARGCFQRKEKLVLIHGCLETPRALLLEQHYYENFAVPSKPAPKWGERFVTGLRQFNGHYPYVEVDAGPEGPKKEGESKWKSRRFNNANT